MDAATQIAAIESSRTIGRRRWALAVLLAISSCAFIDRAILNTVGQAIKDDLKLSDTQLGLLGGLAFSILYGVLGVPVARLTERHSRVKIIAVAVTVWSVMTVVCGFAYSFVTLLLARIGVGFGEAGANAPSQSLLADYYPPEKRASVVGILGLGTPIGIVVGGIGGAFVAQNFGWRTAFLIAGAPGLLLAMLALLTVREPVRGGADKLVDGGAIAADPPSMLAVFRRLIACRSFRHMLAAGMITNFIGNAVVSFGHPFFVRAFGMNYTDAAVAFAVMNGASAAGGFLLGGLGSDRLIRRDVRFYGWLPGTCMFIAAPFYIFGFLQRDWVFAISILALPGLFSATYYAPTFAVTQNLVGARMRATAVSFVALVLNVFGLSLGPLITGALSDFFATMRFGASDYVSLCRAPAPGIAAACSHASADGVRFALVAVVMLFFWSGAHFLRAAKFLREDLARA